MARPRKIPQRAPQRAPLMGRTKSGRIRVSDDPYWIDPETIKHFRDDLGLTLQWNRRTFGGQDDRMNMVKQAQNGWEPVDGAEFPQFGVPSGEIDIGGLVLQKRPAEMTDEATEEDYERATGQVRAQIARLEDTPAETLPRDNRGAKMTSFKRGEPIPVRDDSEYEKTE